jgi:hypothetical protein
MVDITPDVKTPLTAPHTRNVGHGGDVLGAPGPVTGGPRRRDAHRIALYLAASATVAGYLVFITRAVYYQARYFSGYPMDGVFQLFNPLRRLADGQLPGSDLQFFHGLGTLLVHYPLFRVFGGDLQASELSRGIVSPLFFMASAALLIFVATRRALHALVGVSILLLLTPLMPVLAFTSNSLLGVRSTLPLVAAAGMILMWRSRGDRRRYLAAKLGTLVMLAASFFMSVEHGVAAILAYLVTQAVFDEGSLVRRLLILAGDVAGTGAAILLMFAVASGQHFLTPIRYALREVPGDQFWYFGVPPNIYLYDLSPATKDQIVAWATVIVCWLVLLAAILVVGRSLRGVRHLADQRQGFLFLFVYSVISTGGYLAIANPDYLRPAFRVVVLATICLGPAWFGLLLRNRSVCASRPGRLVATRVTSPGAALGLAAVILAGGVTIPWQLNPRVDPADYTAGSTLGVHLDQRWQRYVETMRASVPRDASLWSTYASIPEAEAGSFNQSGYDYIIHALGPTRRRHYVESLERTRPEFVQTVRRDFTDYEEWLQKEHWDWYERLLTNYTPVTVTPHSVVWKRLPGDRSPDDVAWSSGVRRQDGRIVLTGLPPNLPDGSLVSVELGYRTHSRLGSVPVLGQLPRYLVDTDNGCAFLPVSLPPEERTWRFPVAVKGGATPALVPQVISLVPGGRLDVTSVRYRVVPAALDTARTLLGWGSRNLSEPVPVTALADPANNLRYSGKDCQLAGRRVGRSVLARAAS